MHGEQEHEPGFAQLHEGGIGPAQEVSQACLSIEGETERPKMQRQEDREREPGKPVDDGGEPQQIAAMLMLESCGPHGSTTAATARRPSASSSSPIPA